MADEADAAVADGDAEATFVTEPPEAADAGGGGAAAAAASPAAKKALALDGNRDLKFHAVKFHEIS